MWIQNQERLDKCRLKNPPRSRILVWWILQQINVNCELGNLRRTDLSGFLMLPVPRKSYVTISGIRLFMNLQYYRNNKSRPILFSPPEDHCSLDGLSLLIRVSKKLFDVLQIYFIYLLVHFFL